MAVNVASWGLGRLLAIVGLILVVVLAVIGKLPVIEAVLFAMAFLAILIP